MHLFLFIRVYYVTPLFCVGTCVVLCMVIESELKKKLPWGPKPVDLSGKGCGKRRARRQSGIITAYTCLRAPLGKYIVPNKPARVKSTSDYLTPLCGKYGTIFSLFFVCSYISSKTPQSINVGQQKMSWQENFDHFGHSSVHFRWLLRISWK